MCILSTQSLLEWNQESSYFHWCNLNIRVVFTQWTTTKNSPTVLVTLNSPLQLFHFRLFLIRGKWNLNNLLYLQPKVIQIQVCFKYASLVSQNESSYELMQLATLKKSHWRTIVEVWGLHEPFFTKDKGTLTLLLGKIFDTLTVAISDSFSLSSTWTEEMVINVKNKIAKAPYHFVKLVKTLWVK